MIQNVESKINAWHWGAFIGCFALMRILIAVAFKLVTYLLDAPVVQQVGMALGNAAFEFMLVVIVSPLIETYLAVFLPFHFLKSRLQLHYIVVISALIFAAFHHYSVIYAVHAFLGGLIYAFAFYAKRDRQFTILYAAAVHSGYNLFVYLYDRMDF
ncbi:CPBP family intramembrane glutamic endopeptidase [Pseudochryseolinea flava]|uniref:CAAX prenyl protease 2/Lysostaphin resistance protein A-like domain-containing protein n=1 Tax=Pseudochryseolinea flava TaxID=2059302 RepID=A0A364Y248_9BACT|nr:CPBP family intramembrane glutamic endopeptidase [Pseudochryseolinea flava]RAW00826.1 hypothetical protein DQQ10_11300 [Pseudochryseolinea flava]